MDLAYNETGLQTDLRDRLQLLTMHFSNSNPIRPMDIFGMNYASTASVAGLMFTYLIVLMQFRVGDSS